MSTKTVVTGTIQNAGGNLATSGYVEFTLQPKINSSLYYVLGTTVVAPQTVRAVINASGQLKAEDGVSALELWGNNTLNPTNTWYKAKFVPEGQVTNTVDLLLINGTTYDLADPTFWEPSGVVPNRQPINFQAIETDIIPGANNAFWLGNAVRQFAAGYIKQLFTDFVTAIEAAITTLTATVATITTATIAVLTATAATITSLTVTTINGLVAPDSNSYSPTLTNTLNVTASTPLTCYWMRIGELVVVGFTIAIDPTAAAPTATQLDMDLPVPPVSNFTDSTQAVGSGVFNAVPGQAVGVSAKVGTKLVSLLYLATNTSNAVVTGMFTYRVLP